MQLAWVSECLYRFCRKNTTVFTLSHVHLEVVRDAMTILMPYRPEVHQKCLINYRKAINGDSYAKTFC